VSSALHTPPQVVIGGNRPQCTICSYNVHGSELIGDQTVVALQPAVATSKSGTQVADTFTGSGD
jgi:hypothetical protein